MSTDVAVRTAHTDQQMTVLTNDQLTYIASTEFVPPGLRGNLPAILACVATGRALGIADMTALRSIHIIDGKATFSAELMVQLVRRKGHSITGDVSDGQATVIGTRVDNGDTMTSTWTLAMADRAGLLGKSNWKKYPEAMLWARAASQLCRMLFADCFAGQTYTPEEIEDADAPQAQAVDMSDPDLPFGDHPHEQLLPPAPSEDPPVPQPASEGALPKPPSAAMLKKLNVLVGKLRPDHLSTLQLWQSMGRDPVPDEDGTLHWSPLRDSLTWQDAHDLIDRLEKYAADKLEAAA